MYFIYFTIIGFIFDENLNGGARPDWLYTNLPAIKDFLYF